MLDNNSRLEISQFGKVQLVNYLGEFFKLNQPSSKEGINNDASVIFMDEIGRASCRERV